MLYQIGKVQLLDATLSHVHLVEEKLIHGSTDITLHLHPDGRDGGVIHCGLVDFPGVYRLYQALDRVGVHPKVEKSFLATPGDGDCGRDLKVTKVAGRYDCSATQPKFGATACLEEGHYVRVRVGSEAFPAFWLEVHAEL
jgi:hypothetical protein